MNTQTKPLGKQTKVELIQVIEKLSTELVTMRSALSKNSVQELAATSQAPQDSEPSNPEPRSPWHVAREFGKKFRMCTVSVQDGVPVYRSKADPAWKVINE